MQAKTFPVLQLLVFIAATASHGGEAPEDLRAIFSIEKIAGNAGLKNAVAFPEYSSAPPSHNVASDAAMNDIAGKLKPGDVVVIASGSYKDFETVIPESVAGTREQKIIIRAEQPGSVELTGRSRFEIRGRHIQLHGFKFSKTGASSVVLAGKYNRLHRCQFTECGDPKSTQNHVMILPPGTQYNEVDYNEFAGSISMSIKVRADALGSEHVTQHNFLHHNLFRDIPKLSSNGGEAIQIAGPQGGATELHLKTRVEHNVFLRVNGDAETISNKTPGNFYRWNIIKDSESALTIRGGSDCVIEGNAHINTRPMRVMGSRHKIVNNLFYNASVFLSHGSANYEAARDILFAHNTIINTKSAIVFGGQQPELKAGIEGNRFVNNILVSTSGSEPVLIRSLPEYSAEWSAERNKFSRNILWAAGKPFPKLPAPAGEDNIVADPKVELGESGLSNLAAGSAAVNAGLPDISARDLAGSPRDAQPDIGANEARKPSSTEK